jgi:hypothetical protein
MTHTTWTTYGVIMRIQIIPAYDGGIRCEKRQNQSVAASTSRPEYESRVLARVRVPSTSTSTNTGVGPPVILPVDLLPRYVFQSHGGNAVVTKGATSYMNGQLVAI